MAHKKKPPEEMPAMLTGALVYQRATARGASAYDEGLRKTLAVYKRLILPPRGHKGSKVNQVRARLVQAALHQAKWGKKTVCDNKRKTGKCSLCKLRVRFRALDAAPDDAHGKPALDIS